jgi:sulfite reductase beta subunit-like hemoprotein
VKLSGGDTLTPVYELSGDAGDTFTATGGNITVSATGITGNGAATGKLTLSGSTPMIDIKANTTLTITDAELDVGSGSIVLTNTSNLVLAVEADDAGVAKTVAKLTLVNATKDITSSAQSTLSATSTGAANADSEAATDILIVTAYNSDAGTSDPAQITTGYSGCSVGSNSEHAAQLSVAGGTVIITGGDGGSTLSATTTILVGSRPPVPPPDIIGGV